MLNESDNDIICRSGPGTPGGKLMRHYWIPVALSSELPGPDCEPLRVRLLGEDLVAFRDSEGKPGLLDALCPHRRAPLFFGRNEQGGLRCAYHGWKFDTAGRCLDLPNEPDDSPQKQRIRQLSYPLVERAHIIWAYMGEDKTPPPLPGFPFVDLPDDQISVVKIYQDQNWLQGLEGVIDPSHVPFLHSAASADTAADAVSALKTERIAEYYWSTKGWSYDVNVSDGRMLLAAWRTAGETQDYWRMNVFLLPFYAMGPVRSGADPVANVNARIPIDDEHHFIYSITWHPSRALTEDEKEFGREVYGLNLGFEKGDPQRPGSQWMLKANRSNDYMIDRQAQRTKTFTGIAVVIAQDNAMTEGMGAIVDRTKEHLVRADLGISATRRVFLRAAKALRDQGTRPAGVDEGSEYKVRAPSKLMPKGVSNWVEALSEFYTCKPGFNPPQP
ncbi:MAG: Rieske 2Fe-2S domain-containing protein [Burkholderiaceae bacterium]|nr:Rieske 2Fe-2S domain-containing protein [Burkholderiaceae bacterium]